jgi:hypothetical protein
MFVELDLSRLGKGGEEKVLVQNHRRWIEVKPFEARVWYGISVLWRIGLPSR